MSTDNVISLYSDGRLHPRLPEDEVTWANLVPYLDNAVWDYEFDEDGDLYVKDGASFPFWIAIEKHRSQITFFTFLDEQAASHEQVNRLNMSYRAVQFTLPRPGRLGGTYYMTFKYGLDTRQFIVMAREFGGICRDAFKEIMAVEDRAAVAGGAKDSSS